LNGNNKKVCDLFVIRVEAEQTSYHSFIKININYDISILCYIYIGYQR